MIGFPEWVLWATLTFLGLSLGSFISAVSYRLPRQEDMVKARSRCTACNTPLDARSLVPLFSWLWYRGKCRFCHASVSLRYPLTELLACAILWFSYGMWAPDWVQVAWMSAIGLTLLCMAIIDLEHRILPDSLQLLSALLVAGMTWYHAKDVLLVHAVAGAVLFALGAALHYGYPYLRGKDGLGWGDVKFFAIVGLWLGFAPLPLFLFLSGVGGIVTGMVWKRHHTEAAFPFGPALFVGVWTTYHLWHKSELGNFFSALFYLY